MLADIEKTPLDPLAQKSIAHIASLAAERPEARAILETLSQGAPGARVTEEARAALEGIKKRRDR